MGNVLSGEEYLRMGRGIGEWVGGGWLVLRLNLTAFIQACLSLPSWHDFLFRLRP